MMRNQDLMESPEIQVDNNIENEPQVKNLLVSRYKEYPETKWYKSSTEKNSCAKYTCKTYVKQDIIVRGARIGNIICSLS